MLGMLAVLSGLMGAGLSSDVVGGFEPYYSIGHRVCLYYIQAIECHMRYAFTQTAKLLFAICLPLLLLSTNLRLAINTPQLYEYGFNTYNVSADSGISNSDLKRVADGLVGYFNSNEDLFRLTVTRYGQQEQLFQQNEALHFRDVKGLIHLDYHVQWVTLGYALVFAVGILVWRKREGWLDLLGAARWGAGLTLGLMAALGVAMAVGFDQLFIGFHELFFNNNLWIALSGDVMTTLFPEEFFRDVLAMIAGAMALEAGLLLVFSWRALRKANQQVSPSRDSSPG